MPMNMLWLRQVGSNLSIKPAPATLPYQTCSLHLQGNHSHVVCPARPPSFIEDLGWELGEMKGQGPAPKVPELREIEWRPGSVGHQKQNVPSIDPVVDGEGNNFPATQSRLSGLLGKDLDLPAHRKVVEPRVSSAHPNYTVVYDRHRQKSALRSAKQCRVHQASPIRPSLKQLEVFRGCLRGEASKNLKCTLRHLPCIARTVTEGRIWNGTSSNQKGILVRGASILGS